MNTDKKKVVKKQPKALVIGNVSTKTLGGVGDDFESIGRRGWRR